jgi:uncharacterized protein (TIGR03083 family)
MDAKALLVQLTIEARRVPATDPATLSAPVPWCGGWSVGDVVGHLSGIQRWATVLTSQPGTWVRRREMEEPPAGSEVLAWCEAGIAPMLAAFDDTDLDATVNTWAGEQPRRWWLRRLVHETAMHRWDIEAGGTGREHATPIAPDAAVDGIDELFDNFLPFVTEKFAGAGETMHLHATDAPGEWELTFTPKGVHVERLHAKGDVAVRARSHDLLLLLWNRSSLADPAFETFGDTAIVERWQRLARF